MPGERSTLFALIAKLGLAALTLTPAVTAAMAQGWRDFDLELIRCAEEGHLSEVAQLLKRGASPNARSLSRGATPLMGAAAGGHADVVRLLLDKGADANARMTGYETALTQAVRAGHTEVVRVLLEKGAGFAPPYCTSPLREAKRRGYREIVEILKTHGAER
jgi:ankyrin repeat protein